MRSQQPTNGRQPIRNIRQQPNQTITQANIKQFVRWYLNDKPRLPQFLQNVPIGNWDISRVKDLSYLFDGAAGFNEDINDWDLSNVEKIDYMFDHCFQFNQPLDKWRFPKLKSLNHMFYFCKSFNQPLNDWDVSNVTNMNGLFSDCETFNQPLDNWDVSEVRNMNSLFSGCESFNQPLDNWDVGNVIDMSHMFKNCMSFNQPLNSWDVSNVKKMDSLFISCSSFNQPLNNWGRHLMQVENIDRMFWDCRIFNQDLSSWRFNNSIIRYSLSMFDNCPIYYEYTPPQILSAINSFNQQHAQYEASLRARNATSINPVAQIQLPPRRPAVIGRQAIPANAQPSPVTSSQSVTETRSRTDDNEFPECIICMDILNNEYGPGPSKNCINKCNDVVKVCSKGHLFHRGCILDACNAEAVNVVAQMGLEDEVDGYNMRQERRNKCPLCQNRLIMNCNNFKTAPAITNEEELKEYKRQHGGKKYKKQTRRIKHRKISKKGNRKSNRKRRQTRRK